MAGKMSRNKGQRGEREVIKLLQPVVDRSFERFGMVPPCLQRNLLQAHTGGHDVFGLDWLALEVKYHETVNLSPWWAQTLRQCGHGQTPVLIWRKSRVPWRVRMYGHVDQVKAVVDLDLPPFLEWLETRICTELHAGKS